jgi:hypothetical protein
MENEMHEFMNWIAEKVLDQLKSHAQQNIDCSALTDENILETLMLIEKSMKYIDLLLEKTRSLRGFGSFYPMECKKKLMTMKTILEMEIKKFE